MAAPNASIMMDERESFVAPEVVATETDEAVDKVVELMGAGGGPVTITTGIPCLEDDNFCRCRCLCYDGGCLKFDLAIQYCCLACSASNGFKIITGLPILEDENFCRSRCCCYDGGCRKFEIKFQWYCLKLEL